LPKINPYSMTSPGVTANGGVHGGRFSQTSKPSPFRLPNDEEVFLQREAEKVKLQELK
jgi:hypothetical protein